MPYLGRSSNFGVRTVFQYLPSAGDTSVSGADANGKTLAFADGNYVDVYLNGVKLKTGTDYNTTTANTIAGLTALASNDEVTVVVYDAFSLATGFETLGGTFGDDITFNKDGVVLNFGADSDVTITHDPDDGLIFKSAATGDDNPFLLTLQTGETDIAANDVLGAINFQAPDEGTGTDAILVAAGIEAVSEGDFSSSSNATKLSFKTGSSEAASEKMSISSAGDMTLSGTLISSTSGDDNVVIGQNAGANIASGGDDNVLIGRDAGDALTTGDQNVAVGFEALSTEDAHGENVAIGYRALKTLNAGAAGYNTAVGHSAGLSITTGVQNTFVGSMAGDALTEGGDNVGIGRTALTSDTLGSRNIAIGTGTLQNQNFTTATNSYNIAIGYLTGGAITTGVENTFVGALAGDATTDADFNVGIGWGALGANTVGSKSVAVGVGVLDAQNPTTATDMHNTAVGHGAAGGVTTGRYNTLMGSISAQNLTEGGRNTALGYGALQTDTLGNRSTALGFNALGTQNFTTATDSYNIGVGYDAGGAITTGIFNSIMGGLAGDALTDADYNVAIGGNSLSTDTKGNKATAVGYGALNGQNQTTSTDTLNVAVGYTAGNNISTGKFNTLIGGLAGASDHTTGLATGSNNVIIGYNMNTSGNASANQIALGVGFACTGDNNFAFGKSGNIVENDFDTDASFSRSSDVRLKKNITEQKLGLDFINDLRTVKYNWKASHELDSKDSQLSHLYKEKEADNQMNTTATMHSFIAQEVKSALDKAGVSDFGGWKEDPHGVQKISREMFIIPLVKAVQELSAKNDALEARIKTLEDA